ncbi:hypothetical protein CDAR_79832 [Caerostris darwini]|nr:hypothetical protein CDAR_79832 [Caerostris darwini]
MIEQISQTPQKQPTMEQSLQSEQKQHAVRQGTYPLQNLNAMVQSIPTQQKEPLLETDAQSLHNRQQGKRQSSSPKQKQFKAKKLAHPPRKRPTRRQQISKTPQKQLTTLEPGLQSKQNQQEVRPGTYPLQRPHAMVQSIPTQQKMPLLETDAQSQQNQQQMISQSSFPQQYLIEQPFYPKQIQDQIQETYFPQQYPQQSQYPIEQPFLPVKYRYSKGRSFLSKQHPSVSKSTLPANCSEVSQKEKMLAEFHPDDSLAKLISTCESNGQCSGHAICIKRNNTGFCRCLPNFHGNGISCWEEIGSETNSNEKIPTESQEQSIESLVI